MSTLNQKFKSDANKLIIIKVIDDYIQSKLQITLNSEFNRIFNDIMDFVFSRFGKKPSNLTDDEHLKNINKVCIDESLKYINDNIGYFPKLKNTHVNNRVQVITDDRERSLAVSSEQPIYQQTGMVPYVQPQQQQQQMSPQQQQMSPQQQQQPLEIPQQNLFRNTDDVLKQMQYARGNGTYDQQSGGGGQEQGRQQQNFALPLEMAGQKSSEQSYMDALESRRKEFPSMNTPQYKPLGGAGEQTQIAPSIDQGPHSIIMNVLLQTPIAFQSPNLIPSIATEIMQMQHLTDMLNKNPAAFQQQIRNPDFLQMIISQIKNKSDPKMKPMDLNENSSSQQSQALTPEQTEINSEFMKRIGIYNGSGVGGGEGLGGGVNPLFENQMNKFIPPSDQLINNTLPDLDNVYLIDYNLSLDFRNDLENTSKNRYLLKFHKYGNVSKIKMLTCLIPENDYLSSEPYIYIKIEELGGRCYTSNHDNVFGKLILTENRGGYLYYKADEDTCIQTFSKPHVFDKLTISFLNYNGKYLNLKEIMIKKTLKLKKQNKLKFVTEYRHRLTQGEEIEIHIYRKSEIDSYNVQVDSVIDERTFTVDNVFDVLTETIKVLKNSVNCCLSFKLYEINWNILTNKNAQNAQLIRLSQLVNDKRKETAEDNLNKEIVEVVKSQLALGGSTGTPNDQIVPYMNNGQPQIRQPQQPQLQQQQQPQLPYVPYVPYGVNQQNTQWTNSYQH